jgi:beta-1,4-N-acetylglucosaminyltransferase
VVLGSGGHTTEMLSLVQALRMEEADDRHPTYSPIVYCKASSDTTSVAQLQQQLTKLSTTTTQTKFPVHDIPRARHVGQSYVSSVWTTLRAQLYALHLVWQLAPRLVLCNGPGTCVPICLAALWFRYLGLLRVEIVFCESLCRVRTLSLTGKLLYFWADVFLVHWDELQAQYPRTTLRTCVFMTASLNKQ